MPSPHGADSDAESDLDSLVGGYARETADPPPAVEEKKESSTVSVSAEVDSDDEEDDDEVKLGPDPCVSTSLADHYRKEVKPVLDRNDQFYSYRYFHCHRFFHGKYDEVTPDKRKLFKLCPKPRITAFTQGSVYFPYEDREEVLRMIAYDVKVESVMYWNQIAFDVKGEGCRLVIDLDSDTRVLCTVEIHKMARILWKTVKEYFTDYEQNPFDIFVAKCGPRIKKGRLSTGVHMIAHCKVTIEQAQQIIFGYELRLKKDETLNMRGIEVDAAIYKPKSRQVSARMIYCNKIEPCPLCQDLIEKRMACNFCQHGGQVISKSTYVPMSCINPTTGKNDPAYFQKKNPDFLQIVRNYSIWPTEEDQRHDYAKPPVDPVFVVPKRGKNAGADTSASRKRKTGSLGNAQKKLKKLKHTNESYELLEEYLRNINWKGQRWWDGIDVDTIALTENSRVAWVYVSGLGCTMCPYAMKDHENNRIWFNVTRRGLMTVYCHSKKKEYPCSNPKERIKFELPGRITQKIFNLDGPPPLDQGRGDEDRRFSFQEFIKRKSHSQDHHMRPKDEDTLKRENTLKRLSEFYQLGHSTK